MDVFGELIKHEPRLLERPIEELAPISFIGQAAVAGYRALIGRLDSLPMTEDQKTKTLADGQQAGKMLLAIEGRIGELLPSMDEVRRKGGSRRSAYPDGYGGDKGRHRAQKARAIADNPEAVAEVIAEAEENEDIPTKTAVLNKVRFKKEKERREAAEARNKDKPEVIMSMDEQRYLHGLDQALLAIPSTPPRDWHPGPLQQAKAKWSILFTRGEAFNE